MNNPDKNPKDVNPETGKYQEAMDDKTKILNESTSEDEDIHPISRDFNADDPVRRSSQSDDDLGIDPDTDITEQEIEDLEKSATRMPNEEDDTLDEDYLAGDDNEGTPLNEGNDPMGEDLDISPEDMEANEYDNNDD